MATNNTLTEIWNPVDGGACIWPRLEEPFGWQEPRLVSVCPAGDLFEPCVPMDFLAPVFGVMAVAGATRPGDPASAGSFFGPEGSKGDNYGPHQFHIRTQYLQRANEFLNARAFRTLVAQAAYRNAGNRRNAGYLAHQIDTKTEERRCYPPGRMWPLFNVTIVEKTAKEEPPAPSTDALTD